MAGRLVLGQRKRLGTEQKAAGRGYGESGAVAGTQGGVASMNSGSECDAFSGAIGKYG